MIMMDDHTTIWCTLMYAIITVNGWCGFTEWCTLMTLGMRYICSPTNISFAKGCLVDYIR
jgi:hypothetical protein